MKKNLLKFAKKFLPLIGLVLFIYLLISLGLEDIKNTILSISPIYFIVSALLTIPVLLIRNYAWQIILREQKITVGYFKSLKILIIGFFYGTITPGYMGHAFRILYLKEETNEPYGKLFVNTFIDTIIRSFAQYGMMIFGAILIIITFHESIFFYFTFGYFVISLLIIFYFLKKERGEKLFFTLIKYLIPKRLKTNLNRFVKTFYNEFPKTRVLIFPFFLGFIIWIIIFTQVYLFVIALGLETLIPYHYFIFLFPIANTAGFAPITFAGLGTRELTSIYIFQFFKAEEHKILVFTLAGFIVTDLILAFVGFLFSLTEAGIKEKASLDEIFTNR